MFCLPSASADAAVSHAVYAELRGTTQKVEEGKTLYVSQGSTIYLHFDYENNKDSLLVGWIPQEKNKYGFSVGQYMQFKGDDTGYSKITTGTTPIGTVKKITIGVNRFSDVFDENGDAHWETAKPIHTGYIYIKVGPKTTAIKSLTALSKGFKLTWSQPSGISGYQIQYATGKSFTTSTSVTISKKSTVSKTVKNLKASKGYYVRLRTYKLVNDKKVYSSWSKVKYIKTLA